MENEAVVPEEQVTGRPVMAVHPTFVRHDEVDQGTQQRSALIALEAGNAERVTAHEQVRDAGFGMHLDQRTKVGLAVVHAAVDAFAVRLGEVTEIVGL